MTTDPAARLTSESSRENPVGHDGWECDPHCDACYFARQCKAAEASLQEARRAAHDIVGNATKQQRTATGEGFTFHAGRADAALTILAILAAAPAASPAEREFYEEPVHPNNAFGMTGAASPAEGGAA